MVLLPLHFFQKNIIHVDTFFALKDSFVGRNKKPHLITFSSQASAKKSGHFSGHFSPFPHKNLLSQRNSGKYMAEKKLAFPHFF